MGAVQSFTGLHAWKQAHALVLMVYSATKTFPKEEMFGLTNQIRRAAVSISSNIAEGFSRTSIREKHQFYSIALGSLSEVQNQVLIAKDVDYLSRDIFHQHAEQTIVVSKLLRGLMRSVKHLP
jgi:four helix bundle protein